MRPEFKLMLVAVAALLLAGCSQEPESLPSAPAAPSANAGTDLVPVSLETPAPPALPPPGAAAVAPPIAAPAPLADSDLLGGSGRPLTEEEKMLLNYGIDMFKTEKGHYPATLAEAVASKHIMRLPKLPPDEQLSYNPQTGQVTVSKK